jgi:hypothetical protein
LDHLRGNDRFQLGQREIIDHLALGIDLTYGNKKKGSSL